MTTKKQILYSGNNEIIVCSPDDENVVLKEYFEEGKRDLQEYQKTESNGPVVIRNNNMNVKTY